MCGDSGQARGDGTPGSVAEALTVPVVTGHADMTVIDKITALASAGPAPLSAEARSAHRYAIARLAVDFVSGPGGPASALRTGLLEHPFSTPSLPLDIGLADSIPGHIPGGVAIGRHVRAHPDGLGQPR